LPCISPILSLWSLNFRLQVYCFSVTSIFLSIAALYHINRST
jgi:hypothetical protein